MNKSSRFFWFFVLAQACAVASVLGWLLVRRPPPRITIKTVPMELRGRLETILNMFSNDCGRFPTTAEGFQALINYATNNSLKGWRGPYFDPPKIPQDPWGNNYVYRCPGIHNTNGYDLYSTGPDGKSKSGGNDPDDINNWDINSPHGGDFSAHDPLPEIASLLLMIPLACGFCSIAMIFSPEGREFFSQNSAAYIIWFVFSVIAFIVFLSNQPPVYGRLKPMMTTNADEGIRVRPAKPNDAQAIARISVESWQAAYRGHITDAVLNAQSVDLRAAFWRDRLSESRGRVFVAEKDGSIIGFCDLIPTRDKDVGSPVGEIAALYILSHHWRQGAGRALCNRILAEARRQGYAVLTLWVLESNRDARCFYEAMGFSLDGARKSEKASDGSDLREVRFHRRLS